MPTIHRIRSRAWSSPDDLAAMTAAVSRAWLGGRRPLVSPTVGDLEWWTALGGPDADWSKRVRIWEDDDAVVGWGWFNPPGSAEWFVADGLRASDAAQIRDRILDWAVETASAEEPRPALIEVWGGDGWPDGEALLERGWTAGPTELTQYGQPLDVDLDPLRVPDGYRLRSMTGPLDIPARVAVHRAAFAPSKLTVEKYELVIRQPHYAFDRDIVIEAPDGTFAAFAICWADPLASVGEFEPVGVHPDHQRRGLGRVVMRAGLRRLRELGLRDAVVFSLRANAASEALYRSAGFRELARHRLYTKALG
ncbi:MAG TPA: GNAT family N-acetyltransferase [Candidatus Limnocylindrales bacterium]|nr:GNAT family N-acetyltransferase [Candidatus Limnocylindrales bacterium]